MSNEDKLEFLREFEEISGKAAKSAIKPLNIIALYVLPIMATALGWNLKATYDISVTQAKESSTYVSRDYADAAYLQKLQYYQMEEDEHRMMIRLFNDNTELTNYIFGQINDNISSSLGFKYTTRGK